MNWFTCCICLVSTLLLPAICEGNIFHKSDDDEVVLNTRQISCSQKEDCFPENVTAIPTSLVECLDGICSCNECFSRVESGRCAITYPDCYDFNSVTLQCDDERDSQLVAFLLSFFLSSVGAANFYIGQDDLAVGQLVLFIIVVLLPCCVACIPCCLFCCVAGDEAKGSIVAICFFVIVFIVIFAGSLAMFAWWIADVVIFATNARDSGNGCELKSWDA